MIFLFTTINRSSDTTEMSSPSFTADSDWDLFSTEEDNDGDISIEEISDVTKVFSLPDQLGSCSPNANEQIELQGCKREGDISSNEFIKLEDLYDSDITSTQSTNTFKTLLESSLSPSPTTSLQFPNYDQLQNLPNEIVERPRCLSFFTSKFVENGFKIISNRCLTTSVAHLNMICPLKFTFVTDVTQIGLQDNSSLDLRLIDFVLIFSDLPNSGCMVRVIEIIMEALASDVIITKRYPLS